METANYAVMFTDIKGFTERTSRQTRAQNEKLLRLHDALLLPVVHAYDGRRVKTIGDAYLVVFGSATKAVLCGAAIQDRLFDYNQQVAEEEQIHVRVAINTGEVRVDKGDVFGEPVNIAARVEGIADAGEVCLTEATLLLAERSKLPLMEDCGDHELKGISQRVRVFRLTRKSEGAPYGGSALEPLGLGPPDPLVLVKYRLPFLPRIKKLQRKIPLVLALLALVFLVSRLTASSVMDRIESLVEEHRLAEARSLLENLRDEGGSPALVACGEGLVALGDGKGREAVRRFASCAEKDPKVAREWAAERLMVFLSADSCEIRSLAARTLGRLRYARATKPLEDLSKREPPGSGGGFLGFGGCEAGDAAREALERIAERG